MKNSKMLGKGDPEEEARELDLELARIAKSTSNSERWFGMLEGIVVSYPQLKISGFNSPRPLTRLPVSTTTMLALTYRILLRGLRITTFSFVVNSWWHARVRHRFFIESVVTRHLNQKDGTRALRSRQTLSCETVKDSERQET
jgi:hypothetical protein